MFKTHFQSMLSRAMEDAKKDQIKHLKVKNISAVNIYIYDEINSGLMQKKEKD